MEVKVKNFEYEPGGKWSCAHLAFEAETPLGTFLWREVIPGPRHGEDHAELTFQLNGKDVDTWELETPNFEAPNKEGRWADQFREEGKELVEDQFRAWLESLVEDGFDFADVTK